MLLTKKQVRGLISLSFAQIDRLENPSSSYYDPTFSKRVRIGNRRVAWPRDELEAWIETKLVMRASS